MKEGSGIRVYRAREWTMDIVRSRCEEVGDCLIWQQLLSAQGFPRASVGGVSVHLPKFVYGTLLGKRIRANDRVFTKCGDSRCLSPACLSVRTTKQLSDLRVAQLKADPLLMAKVRSGAVQSGRAKLNPKLAEEIRAAPGTDIEKAARYGLCRSTIGRIRRGDSYAPPKVATSIFNLASTL